MVKQRRKKVHKLRGRKTSGWGGRKKHRGKGSIGGKGMAGTGKRADQKKTLIVKMGRYFGKKGFVSIKRMRREGRGIKESLNLQTLVEIVPRLERKGFAKSSKGGVEVDLEKAGYGKLLDGKEGFKLKEKLIVKVGGCSAGAREAVEKAGGKVLVEDKPFTQKKGLIQNQKKKEEKKVEKGGKGVSDKAESGKVKSE